MAEERRMKRGGEVAVAADSEIQDYHIISIDKSWMSKSRLSKEFELGVENFIRFGFSNSTNTFYTLPLFKCPLQVGIVECGYYVMRYMPKIVSKDTSIITDAIDTRNSYSQLELDEVRVEWAKFLARYI
uniref:Uncharacterized protein n=1 Tax=Cucumis melo TaxID=3656 RepID=A0A9I9EHA5_CUCME